HTIQPGLVLAVPLFTFHGSQYLNHRVSRVLASNSQADTGPSIRDILNVTGVRYMQRLNEARHSLTAPLQLAAVNVRAQYGFVFAIAPLLPDRPLLTPSQLGVDMVGTGRIPIVDLNSGDTATPELRSFRQTLGLTASALEHQAV